jgi:hypothetical protein
VDDQRDSVRFKFKFDKEKFGLALRVERACAELSARPRDVDDGWRETWTMDGVWGRAGKQEKLNVTLFLLCVVVVVSSCHDNHHEV